MAAAARPRFPRSFRLRAASAAWRGVVVAELWATSRNSGGALLLPARVPARVPVLAASVWPLLVLALERAVVLSLPLVLVLVLVASLSKRPRVPPFRAMQPLVLAQPPPAGVLMLRARVQPLAVASTRALGLLPGPCYVCTAGPVLGSTIWLRPTTGRVLTLPSRSPAPQGRPHTQARREILQS